MYDPFLPTEVDSFLNPFRATTDLNGKNKSRVYGFNFLNDSLLDSAPRIRWTEHADRQLSLSQQGEFEKRRLIEAKSKESLHVNQRYTQSRPSEILRFSNEGPTAKEFSPYCTTSLTRSSLSTTGTQTLEDRFSIEPFELEQMSDNED